MNTWICLCLDNVRFPDTAAHEGGSEHGACKLGRLVRDVQGHSVDCRLQDVNSGVEVVELRDVKMHGKGPDEVLDKSSKLYA